MKLARTPWIVLAALAAAPAHAVTVTSTWLGLAVSVTAPDKVTFNTPFAVTLDVDSAPRFPLLDPVAFATSLGLGKTVDLAGATWDYGFTSTDPNYGPFAFNGVLGDQGAKLDSTGAQHRIDFFDPLGPFDKTWVYPEWADRMHWTLGNVVIQADTPLTFTLDDGGIQGLTKLTMNVLVLDPPLGGPVPEPASLPALAAGLLLLATLRVRR